MPTEKLKVKVLREIPGPDIRVTHSDPNNSRSESFIAIDPLDPKHMIAASKRFTNPTTYEFSVATSVSFDAGVSWADLPALELLPDWSGVTDPTLAWDDQGNTYLLTHPFTVTDNGVAVPLAERWEMDVQGTAVYRLAKGALAWGPSTEIGASPNDDKGWLGGDVNPASPHRGNVYAAWMNNSSLSFARTIDHGASWRGKIIASTPFANGDLANDAWNPDVSVSGDGTVYIVYLARELLAGPAAPGQGAIKFVKSTDGGDTFSEPAVLAAGITELAHPPLKAFDWFGQFPGAMFRVLTLPTACAAGNTVIAAWAHLDEGWSRIFYRRSNDGGATWEGPPHGQPLQLGIGATPAGMQDFHPQLIAAPDGAIGCAFYRFGPYVEWEEVGVDDTKIPPTPPTPMIDVVLAVSFDGGQTFDHAVTVTDQPWDPAVNAPLAHGNPALTFIGEYFGLDASSLGFFPLWTDTRTGVQELYACRVVTEEVEVTAEWGEETSVKTLAGVIQGGNGIILLPSGKLLKVPPPLPQQP